MSGTPYPTLRKRLLIAALGLFGAAASAGGVAAQSGPPADGRPDEPMMAQFMPPPPPGGGHGPRRCLRGGEMRRAVSDGEALPLGAIMRRLGGGEIVRAMLCETHHGLVYRVAVLNGARVDELVIDARTGDILRRR
ncbi:hypothetical protein [Breoghania sp. JC706]|uniref:PepSY domain-containing protein n=1 Tax=Breoghania sp. JC706 TaxID=3117732 RepID=UPI00300B25E3